MYKLLLSLLVGSSLSFAAMVNGIALTVNDEPITIYDIEKTMEVNKVGKNEAVGYLIDKILYDRLVQELELYHEHKMIPVLRMMKYIVDTLRENNVVWGVGRGSSVASYVLYLLGVHKIDSIKYNIPIEEFFKGEKNG